jgi:hypothetical protein
VVDARSKAEIEVLFDELAGDVANILAADAGVVRPLRRRITVRGETERSAVLIEKIFLLKTEPRVGVVENGRTLVGGVWCLLIGHHDFAHHQSAIGARGIRIQATGFSTQSELWPSACMVEEPSKPHSGSCSSVGNGQIP